MRYANPKNKVKVPCPYPSCGKTFGRQRDLPRHLDLHGDPTVACDFSGCGDMFHTLGTMRNHWKKAHGKVHPALPPKKTKSDREKTKAKAKVERAKAAQPSASGAARSGMSEEATAPFIQWLPEVDLPAPKPSRSAPGASKATTCLQGTNDAAPGDQRQESEGTIDPGKLLAQQLAQQHAMAMGLGDMTTVLQPRRLKSPRTLFSENPAGALPRSSLKLYADGQPPNTVSGGGTVTPLLSGCDYSERFEAILPAVRGGVDEYHGSMQRDSAQPSGWKGKGTALFDMVPQAAPANGQVGGGPGAVMPGETFVAGYTGSPHYLGSQPTWGMAGPGDNGFAATQYKEASDPYSSIGYSDVLSLSPDATAEALSFHNMGGMSGLVPDYCTSFPSAIGGASQAHFLTGPEEATASFPFLGGTDAWNDDQFFPSLGASTTSSAAAYPLHQQHNLPDPYFSLQYPPSMPNTAVHVGPTLIDFRFPPGPTAPNIARAGTFEHAYPAGFNNVEVQWGPQHMPGGDVPFVNNFGGSYSWN